MGLSKHVKPLSSRPNFIISKKFANKFRRVIITDLQIHAVLDAIFWRSCLWGDCKICRHNSKSFSALNLIRLSANLPQLYIAKLSSYSWNHFHPFNRSSKKSYDIIVNFLVVYLAVASYALISKLISWVARKDIPSKILQVGKWKLELQECGIWKFTFFYLSEPSKGKARKWGT